MDIKINIRIAPMSRIKKAEPQIHGTKKKQFAFMLTESASSLIDELSDKMQVSRSEVLERAIRSGSLDFAQDYEITQKSA